MTQSIESMIEVLQAYKDGKKIECGYDDGKTWLEIDQPAWDFENRQYRIAPEPKRKVKLEAWLTTTGALVWYDMSKVNTWSTDCIRVPSLDMVTEI